MPGCERTGRVVPKQSRATRPRALSVCLLLLLSVTACSAPTAPDIAPPEQARDIGDGQWEVTTRNVVNKLTHAVDSEADFRIEPYRVPVDLSWDTVTSYYAEALGQDWQRDDSLPEEERIYRAAAWTNGGLLADSKAAVALIHDPVPGSEPGFHILVVIATE